MKSVELAVNCIDEINWGNNTSATIFGVLLMKTFGKRFPAIFSSIYSGLPTRSGSIRIAGLPFRIQSRTRSTVTPFGFVRLESSSA